MRTKLHSYLRDLDFTWAVEIKVTVASDNVQALAAAGTEVAAQSREMLAELRLLTEAHQRG